MKNSALITILASAAVATAQVTLDNGTYTCSKPNVAFCAGDSLKTDIIVRCDSTGRGQPGRCSDNLAGEPPVGVQPALCYQTDPTIGDAACEKNCVVYGGSGNGNGTFTLPTDVCTPTFTATTSPTSGVITETTSTTETQCGRCESSTASVSTSEIVTESTSPASVETTTPVVPTTTPAFPTGNATVTTGAPTTSKSTTRTTATPIAPTTTSPSSVPTAGAAANAAGCFLAGLGLAVAYIL